MFPNPKNSILHVTLMKKLIALILCAFALPALAGASEDLVVHLAPPSSPCRVNITNECDCPVRLYVVSPVTGRRYFLALMSPGDHFDRQMAPPVAARKWLVTSTSDETLARFTLDGPDAEHVVLRCGHGGAVTTTSVRERTVYSK